tara:strand:+ start:1677 stop:1847 length:171 start_codon:yes stop_codon:yes gene_type:complete
MKIQDDTARGESRELLLKEYFLNAYLIALLKQVGRSAGRISEQENDQAMRRVAGQN